MIKITLLYLQQKLLKKDDMFVADKREKLKTGYE